MFAGLNWFENSVFLGFTSNNIIKSDSETFDKN